MTPRQKQNSGYTSIPGCPFWRLSDHGSAKCSNRYYYLSINRIAARLVQLPVCQRAHVSHPDGLLFVPFVLRLPKGKRSFKQYLDDIGLTRMQPFLRLVLLALSCYVILALSQVAATFVYRLFEGQSISWSFIQQAFDPSTDLPPSLLFSIPAIFEEMAFRGIILTCFLSKYSERKSILFSSIGFGLIHLVPILLGGDPVWAFWSAVWATIIGLFYGYVFVRTRSLLPPMIVHYLGNAFISTLVGYIQTRASIGVQVLYGITLTLGVVPTTLMILWARCFTSRWLSGNNG